jgi:hypothetical protein
MIQLHMQPDKAPLSWAEFGKTSPSFAIALDGFVKEGPRFDIAAPRANFNHHEEVDRLATRATCAQVLMAIRQGLFRTFRDDQGTRADVFANDCDEDVCTAWFLLKNAHLAEHTMNPAINRLVAMEECLDATAGAYPFPADLPALRELAWVFEPYRQFRLSGGLEKREARSFFCVVEDVEHRIQQHIVGKGKEIPLDTRFEVIRRGDNQAWTMVREIGAQARTGMFAAGITTYVTLREREKGRWDYVIGRLSPFIRFSPLQLASTFNKIENCAQDCWGGSDMIIGSPRVNGSQLTPDQIALTLNTLQLAVPK